MTRVALVDYGLGNLRSAARALERQGARVELTADPARILAADRIVLPGDGAFGDCRRGLDTAPGLLEALQEAVWTRGRPFLGVCVGMQLLVSASAEFGHHAGLDWVGGTVAPIVPDDPALKVPHMGWNRLSIQRPHQVLAGLTDNAYAYFIHSFHVQVHDPDHLLATTDYGTPLAAVIGRGPCVGTQFHPEKSQGDGLRLIDNFLRWMP